MKNRSAVTWMFALALALAPRAGSAREPAQVAAQAPAPQPQAPAQIEVLVLQGSNGTGGIAAGLQNLPQLTRPPFSAYSQIDLVSRTTLPLGTNAQRVALPDGNSAAITSQGRLPTGRYEVTVQLSMQGRTHNIQFSATPGDPFFTARSTGAHSALILGFIVR